MKKYKICFVTGSRAEYGLLSPIMKKFEKMPEVSLQIVATGMHLSPEFGFTYKEIERDGFTITEKVEMLLSSDTNSGITKSIGLAVIGFSDVFMRLKPDLVILLGDRYETFAAAIASHVATIPIAHLYGGETTQGAIDEAMRHAITKMSQLHFTSTEIYRKRVIQLGEHPDNVFCVGAIGIENIKKLKLLSKEKLEKMLNLSLDKPTALVTFHPTTLASNNVEKNFCELLAALDIKKDLKLIFTMPNSDTNGRIIISLINNYVEKNKKRARSFINLGTLRYLSLLQYVDMVIGNSSSGIVEVPSFKIPTINIGNRQQGRTCAKSVINVYAKKEKIFEAINQALLPNFSKICLEQINPYEKEETSNNIVKTIMQKLESINIKKEFFDILYDCDYTGQGRLKAASRQERKNS